MPKTIWNDYLLVAHIFCSNAQFSTTQYLKHNDWRQRRSFCTIVTTSKINWRIYLFRRVYDQHRYWTFEEADGVRETTQQHIRGQECGSLGRKAIPHMVDRSALVPTPSCATDGRQNFPMASSPYIDLQSASSRQKHPKVQAVGACWK